MSIVCISEQASVNVQQRADSASIESLYFAPSDVWEGPLPSAKVKVIPTRTDRAHKFTRLLESVLDGFVAVQHVANEPQSAIFTKK